MATARANLETTISADMSQYAATMRRAGMVAAQTAGNIGGSMRQATVSIAKLGPAAVVAAKAIAATAAAALAIKGVKLAAELESTSVAFETMLGSASKATEVMKNLKKLGAETPFEFPELADAARKLIAFGESGDTVTETLRRIGDVASGVQAPIAEIAEIYGKARVQGRLFAEDINQLTGRGIPIIQELAKQFGVTDNEVKGMVEDGKIGFPELEKAFISLTAEGGKFYGMMSKQSQTTLGLFSTLKDAFNELLTEFGKPINDAIKPILERGILLAQNFGAAANALGEKIAKMMDGFMGMIDSLSLDEIFQFAGLTLKNAFIDAVNILAKGVQAIFALFKSGDLGKAFEIAGLKLQQALSLAAADIIESLEPLLGEKAAVGAYQNRANADVAAAQIEAIQAGEEGGKSLYDKFKDEFNKGGDILKMPDDDKAALDEFSKRIKEAADKYSKARLEVEIHGPPKPEAPVPTTKDKTEKVPQADATTFGPDKSMFVPDIAGPPKSLADEGNLALAEISKHYTKKATDAAGAGFKGLSGLYQMQADKASGIGPGESGVFASDRKRLGLVSGLQTGSLGEKRRLATSKDQRDAKKALSAQEAQLDKLSSIDTNIKQALTVS